MRGCWGLARSWCVHACTWLVPLKRITLAHTACMCWQEPHVTLNFKGGRQNTKVDLSKWNKEGNELAGGNDTPLSQLIGCERQVPLLVASHWLAAGAVSLACCCCCLTGLLLLQSHWLAAAAVSLAC